jgi:hypothetical protein
MQRQACSYRGMEADAGSQLMQAGRGIQEVAGRQAGAGNRRQATAGRQRQAGRAGRQGQAEATRGK